MSKLAAVLLLHNTSALLLLFPFIIVVVNVITGFWKNQHRLHHHQLIFATAVLRLYQR